MTEKGDDMPEISREKSLLIAEILYRICVCLEAIFIFKSIGSGDTARGISAAIYGVLTVVAGVVIGIMKGKGENGNDRTEQEGNGEQN